MPLCINDKSFIERFEEKSEEEKERFVEANLNEILDPENRELVEYWWEYFNSKKYHKLGKYIHSESKRNYWKSWHNCLKLARDVNDKRRTSIKFKKATIEEMKLDKEIMELSETEEDRLQKELTKEKKEAEFQLEIHKRNKQEEQSGRQSANRERLEQKKLLEEEEDLIREGTNKRIKNIMEDPILDEREKQKQIAEQQDIRDRELSKIEKRREKLG